MFIRIAGFIGLVFGNRFSSLTNGDLSIFPKIPHDAQSLLRCHDGSCWTEIHRLREDIDNATDCRSCVWTVTKEIMDWSIVKAKEYCWAKEYKRACKWLIFEPEIAMGYIAHDVRPMVLAISACFGAEKCFHSNETSFSSLANHPGVTDGDKSLLVSHKTIMSHLDVHDVEEDFGHLSSYEQDDEDCDCEKDFYNDEDTAFGSHHHHHHHHCPCQEQMCKKCMKHTSKVIVQKQAHKVVQYCNSVGNELPMCRWAEMHPRVALGYLVGAVQPWKGALGFCVGRGQCKSPYRHNHIQFDDTYTH